jgi:hypothetical protein
MNVIEVVQAFDRAPITALKTDDASALESKLSQQHDFLRIANLG